MPWITHLLALINALVGDRSRLTLESIALRQQIVVPERSVKCPIAIPHLGGLHDRYSRASWRRAQK